MNLLDQYNSPLFVIPSVEKQKYSLTETVLKKTSAKISREFNFADRKIDKFFGDKFRLVC